MSSDFDVMFDRQPNGKVNVFIRNGQVAFTDRVDPISSSSRKLFLERVRAKLPGIDIADLEQRIQQQVSEPKPSSAAGASEDPGAASDEELAKMPESVREAAGAMLRSPELLREIMMAMRTVGVVGEHTLALSLYLLGTSRLLRKPLSGCVQGASSSGKTHAMERVAGLFPPETKLMATDMTANALYYVPAGTLRHRFVVAGERSRQEDDDRAETTRALRQMISDGKLHKLLPVKRGEQIESIVVEAEGPIAYVESTTLADLFEEDKNRMLLLASDDSDEQTRAVVAAIADSYSEPDVGQLEQVQQLHWAAQRMLRRVAVHIPFAGTIAEAMPADRPEARRAIHHVLTTVQAVALLHQFQRLEEPEHGAVVLATPSDYRVARHLLLGPIGRALGGDLPEHVRSFGHWLLGAAKPGEGFTAASLEGRPGCRWARATMYRLLQPLHAAGVLGDAGKDGRSNLHRVVGPLPAGGANWLPDPETISVGEGGVA